MGDLEWTMEALINLIKNCMEHSKPGGVVHCGYSGNPLYVEIQVWDDGAGFDTEDLPHLFDRFTGAGVRLEMELELVWLLPVPFLNCRTEL